MRVPCDFRHGRHVHYDPEREFPVNLFLQGKAQEVDYEHSLHVIPVISLDTRLWSRRISRCLLSSLPPPCYSPETSTWLIEEVFSGENYSYLIVVFMLELYSEKNPEHRISVASTRHVHRQARVSLVHCRHPWWRTTLLSHPNKTSESCPPLAVGPGDFAYTHVSPAGLLKVGSWSNWHLIEALTGFCSSFPGMYTSCCSDSFGEPS